MNGQTLGAPLAVLGLGVALAAVLWPWLTEGLRLARRWRMLMGAFGLGLLGVGSLFAGWLGVAADVMPLRELSSAPPLGYQECLQKLDEAATSTPPATAPAQTDRGMVIVSGVDTGTYHRMADDLVQLARERHLALYNRATQGSLDNVRLLASRENAAVGMAQSDLLSWLKHSPDPENRQIARQLRLVLPLHAEEVHVLARRNVQRLADLQGRVVLTPSSSQGSRYTAQNLLQAQGVSAEVRSGDTQAEAVCRVLAGQADAVVMVGGKPMSILTELQALQTHPSNPLSAVHLVALSAPDGSSAYEPAQFTPNDYPWLDAEVPTLAVRALLMAYAFSPDGNAYQRSRCDDLRRFGNALRDRLPRLQQPPYPAKWREVDFRHDVPGWPRDTCTGLAP